jgi:hypothetical protein
MLNADRFLALYFGIRYYIRVTTRKIKLAVLLMPAICVVTTYLTFHNTNGALGIYCGTFTNFKNSKESIIGKACIVFIVVSNIFFYIGLVTMMKYTDQRKVIVKVSVITGSVLLTCTPGLVTLLFFSNTEDKKLYFYAILPVVVKSILNPVIYVWRFKDSRYQLKKALFFWNKRVVAEIEANRKDYYSSYQITLKTST